MKISPMQVTLIDSMGSDINVVNAARVSFAKESDWEYKSYGSPATVSEPVLSQKDQKLIAYLARHNHFTPFCHAFLSFRIKAPIFVARQMGKHQVGLAWNEVSRRYVDEEPEFWFPEVWRGKPVNAKQGSSDVVITEISFTDIGTNERWSMSLENAAFEQTTEALRWYQEAINAGVAPEQARMVLPQNTMTEWIWSGSLAAFARVCKLRLDPHAQEETRQVAQQIAKLVPDEFAHSWKALIDN